MPTGDERKPELRGVEQKRTYGMAGLRVRRGAVVEEGLEGLSQVDEKGLQKGKEEGF